MKEDDLKKIISKSTLETSDDFINKLMHTIEIDQEITKTSSWWSFKPILAGCTFLVLIVTFILFKLLHSENTFLNPFIAVFKTPVFIVFTLILLYGVNAIMRLNESRLNS